MADTIDFVFSKIKDPWTCPIPELQSEVSRLDDLVGFFDTKQLAIKKFINSVYGALGSKYFVAYNVAMAESITAQGRDLNHYSENSVNSYFEGLFQSNPKITLYYQWVHYAEDGTKYTFDSDDKPNDYYTNGQWEECQEWSPSVKKGRRAKTREDVTNNTTSSEHFDWFASSTTLFNKLGIDPELGKTFDISKGKVTDSGPLTGPEFDYLPGTQSTCVAGDTDSISACKSMTYVDDVKVKVEDLFTQMKYENNDIVIKTGNGSEVVPVRNHTTKTFTFKDGVCDRPMKYVMRHKVSKSKWRLQTKSGKEVIVTGDHSMMVVRDGELISVKAKDINKTTDKIISIVTETD